MEEDILCIFSAYTLVIFDCFSTMSMCVRVYNTHMCVICVYIYNIMILIIVISILYSSKKKRESQGALKNFMSQLTSSFIKNAPRANEMKVISAYLRSQGSICRTQCSHGSTGGSMATQPRLCFFAILLLALWEGGRRVVLGSRARISKQGHNYKLLMT